MDGRAALCGLGLSVVLDSGPTRFASFVAGSTFRFKAPEEFAEDLEVFPQIHSTRIYAQTMDGGPPFHWHRTDL